MNNKINTKYSHIITREKFLESDISLTAIFSLASEVEIFFEELEALDGWTQINPVCELNVYLLDEAISVKSPQFHRIQISIFACSFACHNSLAPINPDYIPAGLSTLNRLINNADGVVSAGSIYLKKSDQNFAVTPLDFIYSTEIFPYLKNLLEPVRLAAGMASWHEGPTRLTYSHSQEFSFTNDVPDFQTRSQWNNYIESAQQSGVYFFSIGNPPKVNGLNRQPEEIWSTTSPAEYPGIPIYLNRIPTPRTD